MDEQRHMGFASAYLDESTGETFLFYSDASLDWSTSCVSVAVSRDGISFRPLEEGRALVRFGQRSMGPALFRAAGKFFMAFAFEGRSGVRGIALARADDLLGPYEVLGVLAGPRCLWEGTAIDIGPSVAPVSEREFLVFYSNVLVFWRYLYASLRSRGPSTYRAPLKRRSPAALLRSLIPGRRRLGILRLRITRAGHVLAARYERNPLSHLNGRWGSWRESLFCPGYMELDGQHLLFPTAAIYSRGRPTGTS